MSGNPFTSSSAPAYNLIAPDIGAQQTQLARQLQMADILRQQSMTPIGGTDVVGGWAVKKSPLEGIAKLAQALAGSSLQSKADEKQLALAKAMQERMGSAFDGMAGGASAPSGAAPQAGTAMPALPGGAPQPAAGEMPAQEAAPSAPQLSQVDRIRNQAKAAYMMGNTELANKLLENISTLTNEQRNMAAMGQNPLEMGRYGAAAAHKAGIIEQQPGTTALDLTNGQERFQPKVGEGISLNNGRASALPGYAGASAEIAGANAGAVSAAQAGQKMVTVNTPDGPVMMTEAQAVQQAGGSQPPAAPNPPPLDLNHMTPQQREALMQKAQAQFGLRPGATPGTSAQGQPGIKLQTQAEGEREVGQVKNDLAIQKSRIENAQSPEQQQKLVDAKGVLGLLDAADPLLTSGVPTASAGGVLRDQVTGAFGMSTDASKAAAQLAAIGGALVSKMPKMSGPQSDKDVAQYKEMAGKLGDPYTPIGDRQAAGQILRQLTEKYLADNQGSIANQALQSNTGKPAPFVPTPAKQPTSAAPTKFDAPPPASQFTGKRMRAPDGSIMRSDGKNWIKE